MRREVGVFSEPRRHRRGRVLGAINRPFAGFRAPVADHTSIGLADERAHLALAIPDSSSQPPVSAHPHHSAAPIPRRASIELCGCGARCWATNAHRVDDIARPHRGQVGRADACAWTKHWPLHAGRWGEEGSEVLKPARGTGGTARACRRVRPASAGFAWA